MEIQRRSGKYHILDVFMDNERRVGGWGLHIKRELLSGLLTVPGPVHQRKLYLDVGESAGFHLRWGLLKVRSESKPVWARRKNMSRATRFKVRESRQLL